ncbi:hypothetical protein BT96DRAFT_969291 [Gymnopus androsaceus JB14]|uniref:Hyaluronan/mRNA-binding protein domain-containing protein n=1 Tax=Gymnopus androsaceus JB14 TaxID=1447944 RepID=A0A6A4IFJ3_9AGAR|nr:hypothetical protein BT96DRAFT_969291 [Gymnopus androsaceus JB14]
MSVASKNPFALLDDGADASPAPAAAAPAPPAPAAPARDKKPQTQKGPRGGQYYSRGGARNSGSHADANPNQNGIDQAESAPRKFEGGRGRGRGRGGDARGAGRGGRRPFDKHSATGRTDSVKKVHQGWGGDDGDTELQAEAAATVDAAAEQQSGDAWGAPAGGDAAGWGTEAATTDAAAWDAPAGADPLKRRPRREEEEEDNTLTLDQYLAQKKEKEAAALPEKPQGRQANEGAEGDLFKDAVPIQKGGEEDAYFVGKGKSAPKARTKKEEKVYLEIDARFERPSRGGRGRGDGRGRGEGRGGGGGGRGAARGDRRGGPRGGGARQNNGAPTVNVDDETAFPSLS